MSWAFQGQECWPSHGLFGVAGTGRTAEGHSVWEAALRLLHTLARLRPLGEPHSLRGSLPRKGLTWPFSQSLRTGREQQEDSKDHRDPAVTLSWETVVGEDYLSWWSRLEGTANRHRPLADLRCFIYPKGQAM